MLPNYIISKLKESNIVDGTIKTYISYIEKYMKDGWDESKVLDFSKIEEYTLTLPIKSREGFLLAITKAYDAQCEENRIKIRQLTANAKHESIVLSIKNLDTDKRENITYEEVIKIGKIKQPNPIDDLISKIYTLEVPLRADTWSHVRIVNDEMIDNDFNYLNIQTGNLVLNKYKTVKTYGKKYLKINDNLLEYIKSIWNTNGVNIGNIHNFLIPNRDGNKISGANLNKRLEKIFGYGSRSLRHSFISYKRRMNCSEEEIKKIAYRMNTSYEQVCLVYDDTNDIFK